jgi:hypothetical protein
LDVNRAGRLIVGFWICLAILVIPVSFAAAADSSFGAHLTLEEDMTPHPGIDFRNVGGRGIFSSTISIDYFPSNPRGYASGADQSLLYVSAFGMAQFSFYYGDAACYAGPGLSTYYLSGDKAYLTLLEDSAVHLKFGGLYTFYPVQVYVEIVADAVFTTPLAVRSPRYTVGFSFIR